MYTKIRFYDPLPGEELEVTIPCALQDGLDLRIVSDAILEGHGIGYEVE